MRYEEAFDTLTGFERPRRKYPVDHWLWPLYWAGVRIGWRVFAMVARSPLTVLIRGIRNGWGE